MSGLEDGVKQQEAYKKYKARWVFKQVFHKGLRHVEITTQSSDRKDKRVGNGIEMELTEWITGIWVSRNKGSLFAGFVSRIVQYFGVFI